MKIFYLLFLSITSLSCSNNNKSSADYNNTLDSIMTNKRSEQLDSSLIIENNTFTLDKFKNIPEEVYGCICYFYLTKDDEKNKEYIYVNDFANLAYVSINGKIEEFNLSENEQNDNIYLYTKGSFNLKIEIVNRNTIGTEADSLNGFICLSKGKIEIRKKFIGYCGC